MMSLPRSFPSRVTALALALAASTLLTLGAPAAHAQAKKDSVVLGMILEPAPGSTPPRRPPPPSARWFTTTCSRA